MAQADGIRKLQQQAAACTEELLDISNDISNEVLPLYTGADRGMFDLQCRLQLTRCRKLSEKLSQISAALQAAADITDPQTEAAAEQVRSAGITLQIIAQNQAILDQKCLLLQDLLIGSAQAKSDLEAAEKLQDTADVMALRSALGKEIDRCRSGNEK